MTQQDKELLLIDLCARLPYGIIVQQSAQYPENHFMHSVADKWKIEPHDFKIIGVHGENTLVTDKHKEEKTYAKGIVSSPITICIYNNFTKQIAKPYLRPMSSMTEKEKEELKEIGSEYLVKWENAQDSIDKWRLDAEVSYKRSEFYNYHLLDWRGLIPKGLALEAPEGMYNLNK